MLEKLFLKRYLLTSSHSSVVRVLAWISISGISLGVLTMIVVLSVMSGFDEAIEKRLLHSQPHLTITGLTPAQEITLKKDISTQSMTSFSRQDVIVRTVDGLFTGAEAYGAELSRINQMGKRVGHSVEIIEDANGTYSTGKTKSSDEKLLLGKDEIAIGVDLARSLGVFEGDEVTVISPESLLVPGETPTYQKVKVRALLRADFSDYDSKYIYFRQDSQVNGLRKFRDTASLESGFEIMLPSPDYALQVKERLIAEGVTGVKTWQDLNSALFYSLKMEKRLMSMFLGLTILISSFSIMSVLFLLVTEKEKDVGILKALGAKKKQIMAIFIYIGLILGALGIGSGTLLGLLICWVIKTFPIIHLPDVFLDTHFPVKIEFLVIAGIVLLGAILTFLSAIGPAIKVANTDPLDSFRS